MTSYLTSVNVKLHAVLSSLLWDSCACRTGQLAAVFHPQPQDTTTALRIPQLL